MNQCQTVAIIPAAGAGQRMNAGINKIWLSLNGQSVLAHVLKTFQGSELIEHIVLVVNQSEIDQVESFMGQDQEIRPEKFSLIAGGNERQNSVANGLKFLKNWSGWYAQRRMVIIHDAARALITTELLRNSIESCLNYHSVGVAVPVKDTIKQVDAEQFVTATPDRSALWAVQTPQIFDFDLLLDCHERVSHLDRKFTDDCSIVEYCGYPVKLILGSYENLKITTPEDIILAEAFLRRRSDADRTRI